MPTTALEVSDGLTTRAPAWKQQGDTVNGSVNASDPSDRRRLRHQGNLTPKLEFGGKEIETEVRSDEKRMNRDRLTYQRVPNCPLDALTRNAFPTGEFPPKIEFRGKTAKTEVRADGNQTDGDGRTSQRPQNQPLDPLTRNVPPTGEMDDLRGPTCSQNGYSCNNDLETCKNGDKRTVKEGKGQPNANGIRDSPCAVETDSNKSCNIGYSNAKAATESCDSALMANAQRGTTTKGLTAVCNTSDCCDLRSTTAPNKIYYFPGHSFGETDDLCDYNAIKTDDPPTKTNAHATAY